LWKPLTLGGAGVLARLPCVIAYLQQPWSLQHPDPQPHWSHSHPEVQHEAQSQAVHSHAQHAHEQSSQVHAPPEQHSHPGAQHEQHEVVLLIAGRTRDATLITRLATEADRIIMGIS
jgi:hypothetical protein